MSRRKEKPSSDSDDDSRESLRGAENASTSDDDSEHSDSDNSNPTDTESGSSVASDSSSSSDDGAGAPTIGKKKQAESNSDSDSDSEEDDVTKLRGLELFDDEEGFGSNTGSRRRSSVSMRISHKRRAVLEKKAGLADENAKNALKLEEDRYSDSSDSSFEIPDSEDDDHSENGENDDGSDSDSDSEDGSGNHKKTGKKKGEATGEKVKADFAAKREARYVRIMLYYCSSFLFLFVCLCLSLSYPSVAVCLRSLTLHDTSLTIISSPPSIEPSSIDTIHTYSHYLLQYYRHSPNTECL
jgi:hypothetical protein